MAIHVTYVSDQRFFHHRGSWYTTASFPLDFIARHLDLAGWTFWGRLDETDDPSRLFPLVAPPGLQGAVSFEGPRRQRAGVWGYARAAVLARARLRRAVRRADVVWLKQPTVFAMLAHRHVRRGQVVVSQQVGDASDGLALTYPRYRVLGRLMARACRSSAAAADVATFVSRSLAERYGGGRADAVISNESRLPDGAVLAVPARRGPSLEIAYVGRLAPEKCVGDLLRAIAAVPGATLRVVGDGPLRGALESESRSLGVADRVTWRGYVPWGPALLSELRACAALVLPSATEGMPLVVLEAMSQGVPVVGTRVGGIPEVVEDGVSGLLVDVHRPDQIAAALRRLAADEDLRLELARAALETARRNTLERQLGPLLAHVRRIHEERTVVRPEGPRPVSAA